MSIRPTSDDLYVFVDRIESVRIDSFSGDVNVALDAEPGNAEVILRSGEAVDMEPATVACQDGVLTIDVPPLLNPNAGRRGFALDLGPFKIGRGAVSVDVEVRVPAGADVTVVGKAGDVNLEGPAGAVDIKTETGDVHADSVTGGAVTTGAGDVGIDGVSGDLKVSTGTGDVGLDDVRGAVTAKTGSGDVSIRLVEGSVDVTTGSGDVEVEVPRGIAVWLDLSSGLGDVERDLDSAGEPADGAPYLSVAASAGTGDVHVHH